MKLINDIEIFLMRLKYLTTINKLKTVLHTHSMTRVTSIPKSNI